MELPTPLLYGMPFGIMQWVICTTRTDCLHHLSGLITKDKYNYVKGFAIAGDDKKFYWTKVAIIGNKVSVYSDIVPFHTDSWDGQTK